MEPKIDQNSKFELNLKSFFFAFRLFVSNVNNILLRKKFLIARYNLCETAILNYQTNFHKPIEHNMLVVFTIFSTF